MLLYLIQYAYLAYIVCAVLNVMILLYLASGYIGCLTMAYACYSRNMDQNCWVELVWLTVPTLVVLCLVLRVVVLSGACDDVSCCASVLQIVGNQWFWVMHAGDDSNLFVYGVKETAT